MKAKTKSSQWVGGFSPVSLVEMRVKQQGFIVVLTVQFAPKTHLWFISLLVTRLLSQNTNPEQIRKSLKYLRITHIIH